MTHEEILHRFLQTRTPESREALIMQSVSLVHFVLGRLGISRGESGSIGCAGYGGSDYEDLASQGLLGLIEAVDHFDPTAGAQFSTYAILRVRGAILDYLRNQDWLSRSARRRAQVIQNAISDLWKETRRSPTNEEIARYLQVPLSEVENGLSDASQVFLSLDSFVDLNEGDETSLHDVVPDDNQPDPGQVFDSQDQSAQVLSALQQMNERDRLILSLYYYEELTLKEIGAVIGVSEARVCQLHARAIFNLKVLLTPDHKPSRTPAPTPKRTKTEAMRYVAHHI